MILACISEVKVQYQPHNECVKTAQKEKKKMAGLVTRTQHVLFNSPSSNV